MDSYEHVDAGVYLFDHRRFQRQVVPAFRRLHADDEVEPWLAEVWRTQPHPPPVPRFTPRLRDLTADLMANPDLVGSVAPALHPPTRRPKRGRPADAVPHQDEATADWRRWCELQYLMQLAVERTCLGEGLCLSDGFSVMDACADVTLPLAYDPDVAPLLQWLEERALVWAYGDDEGFAGVRGWLDPDESWLLADGLSRHQLVHHATTFEAIRAARDDASGRCSDGNDHPWRLATVRAVAAVAAGRDRGLLWGWNLSP